MTLPQIGTLRAVSRLEPVTVGAIAKAIYLSQATVTGVLDRLEKPGLVRRTRAGTDRRSVLVKLTGKGREVLTSLPSLLQDHFRRELGRVQEWERTQILATLQRIAAMMAAEEIEAVPVIGSGAAAASPEEVSEHFEQVALRNLHRATRQAVRAGGRAEKRSSTVRRESEGNFVSKQPPRSMGHLR